MYNQEMPSTNFVTPKIYSAEVLQVWREKKVQETYIEVSKHEAMNQADLRLFEQKLELKKEIEIAAEIGSISVFKSADDEINVCISSLIGNPYVGKLCNAKNFSTVLFVPMGGKKTEGIFKVCFDIGNQQHAFWLAQSERGGGKIVKKIRAAGANFFLSRRKLLEAADPLENFILEIFDTVLVPLTYGWILTPTGNWVFVKEGELIWGDIKNAAN